EGGKMKYLILFFVLILLVGTTEMMAIADDKASPLKGKDGKVTATAEKETRVYPIAAGVWYPTDGPIPEKPIRYYRVRCWPGCHSGSSYGMYPKNRLKSKPIWPTDTIDLPIMKK
ncbi:MAG: hypothetical protein ACE5DO_14685, partial [Desulfobacterales bacterium]